MRLPLPPAQPGAAGREGGRGRRRVELSAPATVAAAGMAVRADHRKAGAPGGAGEDGEGGSEGRAGALEACAAAVAGAASPGLLDSGLRRLPAVLNNRCRLGLCCGIGLYLGLTTGRGCFGLVARVEAYPTALVSIPALVVLPRSRRRRGSTPPRAQPWLPPPWRPPLHRRRYRRMLLLPGQPAGELPDTAAAAVACTAVDTGALTSGVLRGITRTGEAAPAAGTAAVAAAARTVAGTPVRCSISAARSGARPAHSRKRLISRAWAKASSESIAIPTSAAKRRSRRPW